MKYLIIIIIVFASCDSYKSNMQRLLATKASTEHTADSLARHFDALRDSVRDLRGDTVAHTAAIKRWAAVEMDLRTAKRQLQQIEYSIDSLEKLR